MYGFSEVLILLFSSPLDCMLGMKKHFPLFIFLLCCPNTSDSNASQYVNKVAEVHMMQMLGHVQESSGENLCYLLSFVACNQYKDYCIGVLRNYCKFGCSTFNKNFITCLFHTSICTRNICSNFIQCKGYINIANSIYYC